jgi:hypothetical protein
VNLSGGVSVGQLLLAMAVVIIGLAATWGGLLQRVKTLEAEVAKLAGLGEKMARVEEQLKGANGKLDQIMGSWLLREPPGYEFNSKPAPRRRPD